MDSDYRLALLGRSVYVERKYCAARLRKNVVEKFEAVYKLTGKNKQTCIEDALEDFTNKILREHLSEK